MSRSTGSFLTTGGCGDRFSVSTRFLQIVKSRGLNWTFMKPCIHFKAEYAERTAVLESLRSNVARYKAKCAIFAGNNKGLEFISWKLINFLTSRMYLATVEDALDCKQSLISPRISTEVKVPQEPDLTRICIKEQNVISYEHIIWTHLTSIYTWG